MKISIVLSITFFLVLSLVSIALSGAPMKVHIVDIGCLFIALVFATIIAERFKSLRSKVFIWISIGVIGLFVFDILSSLMIFKREVFMGWDLIYPIGLSGLVMIQFIIVMLEKLWPFNLAVQRDGKGRATI